MTSPGNHRDELLALMAEYTTADDLVAAAEQAYDAGYRHAEAYAPFAVEGLAEAVGFGRNRVPLVTLLGGLGGAVAAFLLQWYSSVIDYPFNIGGRPFNSWPMFMPVTFEVGVLCAVFAAVIAMLVGNRLPDLSRRLFDLPDFDLAMRNRFFLVLRADEPVFDRDQAHRLLAQTHAVKQVEVPA
jgi:hypothetical protein